MFASIGEMSTKVPNIKLKIDPRNLQIQTFTVEKLLEPLIIQVTTLVNCPQNPSSKKKGRSKRARVLLASVEEATWNLLDKGEKIAQEAAVFKEELHAALADVRRESGALQVSAEAFTSDPCSLPRRQAVVPAARSLLAAVTRLLVLADMVDVAYLLQHLAVFQRTFESLKNVSSKSDLQKTYQKFQKDLENLDYLAYKRQQTDKAERSNALNVAIDSMCKRTRDLRRQLRKAIIDHISDSFLDTTVPLLVLIEAAKNGREKEIKEYAAIFREHTSRLVEVANLACSLSTNEDGTKIVQMAANHIETLCPQVINAALALAARPKSQVVKNNMEMYRSTWESHIRVLTEAVDDITSIDDFLAVSESHILEDVNRCIVALREQDAEGLDRAAGAIRGRATRVAHVVAGEMDNYEPGAYTQGVLGHVQQLSGAVIPEFISQVNIALESLSKNTVHLFDDNQFVDISKKVYDTIHNIRCSVMMIRTPEELEDVSDLEEEQDTRSRTSAQTEGRTDRAKMTQLPEAEKEKIAEQVADFKKVKSKLDAEIEIWDDTSNDIIVLAKRMCVIMMEMTDFTRGRGPLKHTADVINAAKVISESGSRMDALARLIADQCPDQSCKQDLLAYLEQIKLYSHQLKICSQVKAEIQHLGGELIMSALDSVTSLIQAAKNLMNSVVQTVKMSYIASTKIIKIQSPTGPRHPVVMWRMKAPEKKPLIKREKPEEIYAAVRKGSAKKRIHPVQVMSEFRGREIV
ncbi:catenin alpha-3 isoform X4 [Zonotrichia albicollis]|uniref:catenin alpha-3 isoform X4 n=1 Tax=Zonotrichia albicollis TaxID=44394 RepID=UPI003D811822